MLVFGAVTVLLTALQTGLATSRGISGCLGCLSLGLGFLLLLLLIFQLKADYSGRPGLEGLAGWPLVTATC